MARASGWAVLLCLSAACTASAQTAPSDPVARGAYLAIAGDCAGCHTPAGSQSPSGGVPVQTPFGSIDAPNITPDNSTGIGTWSDDDFYRLMHEGIRRDGSYVYPVMPIDGYTKVTRDDVLAIKAYLFSLPPVHSAPATNHLGFPFNIRAGLAAWRELFFRPTDFVPDPARTAEQNRGAYLVEGLGHCGSCHTPRNLAMATEPDKALGGGEIAGQGWFAPNISSDLREGIGGLATADIVTYLKTGIAPGFAIAAGPMTEIIHDSLRHLGDADLRAIAVALKTPSGQELYPWQHAAPSRADANAYLTECGFCHQPDGKGTPGVVPPLAGNGPVRAGGADDMIRTIQGGLPARGTYAAMPGLAALLPSARIAVIANYVRASFGNEAPQNATAGLADTLLPTTHTMWSGTAACDAVAPPLGRALAAAGIDPLLRRINAANMLEQIDAILPRLKAADATLPQAETINGLTAAYCAIVMDDQAQPRRSRLELMQRFASLVYSQLVAKPGPPAR
jgi:mono/diheme cytochrome c family protein